MAVAYELVYHARHKATAAAQSLANELQVPIYVTLTSRGFEIVWESAISGTVVRTLNPQQPIDCTGDPLDDDDLNCCEVCGSVEPCECNELWDEEPAMAGEVTGYDNGPTFW